jgi:hypothetical protein
MAFPINARSEGRVLVPWEHRKYYNLTEQDSSGMWYVDNGLYSCSSFTQGDLSLCLVKASLPTGEIRGTSGKLSVEHALRHHPLAGSSAPSATHSTNESIISSKVTKGPAQTSDSPGPPELSLISVRSLGRITTKAYSSRTG